MTFKLRPYVTFGSEMKWKQMAVADRVREALLPSWFYLNLLAS
jgi:hypothetical protein